MKPEGRNSKQGFSLIELVVVIAILLTIATIAVPQIQKINRNYKLHAAGHTVAGLIQQARLQAVKSNQPAYVQFDNTVSPNIAYITTTPGAAYAGGPDDVAVNGDVSFRTTSLPSGSQVTQLYTYMGVPTSGPSATVVETGTVIGFNGRGLPCIGTVANPTVCIQKDGAQTPAFLWLMALSPNFNEWEAVTVTPAGRVKSWRLTNASTGNWQ
ncbi:MAG TPA: prepilin-type N-terminal cleavage/methylation domain-containing protein [Candidatus Angelobacter sp.]|jgi:prepilin-type N-terminal cleavage/methylation domain-containing protein|nr:prepilin-type N-terminal cleavage/methylation domain-containing protein [Candidatus Angelobacter sp.]